MICLQTNIESHNRCSIKRLFDDHVCFSFCACLFPLVCDASVGVKELSKSMCVHCCVAGYSQYAAAAAALSSASTGGGAGAFPHMSSAFSLFPPPPPPPFPSTSSALPFAAALGSLGDGLLGAAAAPALDAATGQFFQSAISLCH